jgi:hypothetical protein
MTVNRNNETLPMKPLQVLTSLSCALLIWFGATAMTAPLGTSFSYQGRLVEGGVAANGSYDLQFTLFDAESGGTLVAGPIAKSAVAVANGLFTVRLDFGAGVFTGEARWLEIGAKATGAASFTTLSPRQEVLPTLYALHSARAQSAAQADSVTGPIADSQLSPRVVRQNDAGNVSIGTSEPRAKLDVTTTGESLIGDAHSLTLRLNAGDLGASAGDELRVASFGFKSWNHSSLGIRARRTTDGGDWYSTAIGLGMDVDHTPRAGGASLWLNANGNVGIGTATPSGKLTVVSPINGYGLEHTDGDIRLGTYLGGSAGGGWLGTISNHKLNFFVNDGSASMTVDTTGNVGIGTTTPTATLDVNGTVQASGPIKASGGLIIETRTSDPPSPVTGQIWLRTDR